MTEQEQLLDLLEKNKNLALNLYDLASYVEYVTEGFTFTIKNKLTGCIHNFHPTRYKILVASIEEVSVQYTEKYDFYYIYLKLKEKENSL